MSAHQAYLNKVGAFARSKGIDLSGTKPTDGSLKANVMLVGCVLQNLCGRRIATFSEFQILKNFPRLARLEPFPISLSRCQGPIEHASLWDKGRGWQLATVDFGTATDVWRTPRVRRRDQILPSSRS